MGNMWCIQQQEGVPNAEAWVPLLLAHNVYIYYLGVLGGNTGNSGEGLRLPTGF